MDPKVFLTVFATVLLAELGDKTQLATMLFATQNAAEKWWVFAAAALALIVATAIAVIAGQWLAEMFDPKTLGYAAGSVFVGIGVWTIWATALRS